MEKISLFSYNVEDEYKKIEKAFPDLDINTGIIPLDYLEKTDFLKDLEKIYTTKETEKFKKNGGMTKEEILIALNEINGEYEFTNIYFDNVKDGKCNLEVLDMKWNDYLVINGIPQKEIENLKKYRNENIVNGTSLDNTYAFISDVLSRSEPESLKLEINYNNVDFFDEEFSKQAIKKCKEVELVMARSNEMPFQIFKFKDGNLDTASHFNIDCVEDIRLKVENNNLVLDFNKNKSSGIKMELIENAKRISEDFINKTLNYEEKKEKIKKTAKTKNETIR